jgi:hypothetical protein
VEKLHPLLQEFLDFYATQEEWENFFSKLHDIIKVLLSVDPFGDNQKLKKECQEVLILLNDKNTGETRRYENLVKELFNLLAVKQGIYIRSKLS